MPLLSSDIKILNFSSHEDAPKIADQSYGVSYRPNARHALSRISRVIKGKCRLRVVPHFSSEIVERAKRERA